MNYSGQGTLKSHPSLTSLPRFSGEKTVFERNPGGAGASRANYLDLLKPKNFSSHVLIQTKIGEGFFEVNILPERS
jgi:hypothetical protein